MTNNINNNNNHHHHHASAPAHQPSNSSQITNNNIGPTTTNDFSISRPVGRQPNGHSSSSVINSSSAAGNKKIPLGLHHPHFMFCGSCSDHTTAENDRSGEQDDAQQQQPQHVRLDRHLQPAVCPDDNASMDPAAATASAIPNTPSSNRAATTASSIKTKSATDDDDDGIVRSTLAVEGVCCASEVPAVQSILRPHVVSGAGRGGSSSNGSGVQISIATKRVYVHHYYRSTTAQQLCDELTARGFPARIVRDGGATEASLTRIQTSKIAIATATDGSKTSHCHCHCDNHSHSHHHNHSDIEATRTMRTTDTDGISINSKEQPDQDGENDCFQQLQLHIHVVLSGFFWMVSIAGALCPATSPWRHLIYAGLLSVATGLPPVARKAARTLCRRPRHFDANCMMVTAALGAVLLGEFDEAASVSFLFATSELLEARASRRARVALQALVELRPDYAHLLVDGGDNRDDCCCGGAACCGDDDTGDTNGEDDNQHKNNSNHCSKTEAAVVVVAAESLTVGSRIRVRTGDKIAADGVVESGHSSVDQSSLTGESVPVPVGPGSTVTGGAINVGRSPLIVRTTATVQNSAVSRLIQLVEDAQANRSPTEKMVDAFARAYTPAVVSVASVLAIFPWLWGVETGRYWTLNALILIVIACPCALTISTPVTYAAGLAAAAQRGIVCKGGGASLEALGSVETVVLDKTGTITEGNFALTALQIVGEQRSREQVLALLSVMEGPSSHPLSETLVQAAQQERVSIPKGMEVENHVILKGEGVAGTVYGKKVYVGNQRLFARIDMYQALPDQYKALTDEWSTQQGGTVGFIGIEGEGIVGCYCVMDVVRPEARDAIEALQLDGFDVLMLTGDGKGAAKSIAQQVGLSENAVHAELLPEDKLHFVGSLKYPSSQGSTFGLFRGQPRVLFCGDGVNDAPALAVADVGVSMGEGAALAMEMSDVTLMDSNLSKIVYLLEMGSKVLQTIRENILLSLFCKLAVVVLTFGGYMTLLYAIVSDVGVMLLVTLNGMKLIPGNNGKDGLSSSQNKSRWFAWKFYDRLDDSLVGSQSSSENNETELV